MHPAFAVDKFPAGVTRKTTLHTHTVCLAAYCGDASVAVRSINCSETMFIYCFRYKSSSVVPATTTPANKIKHLLKYSA